MSAMRSLVLMAMCCLCGTAVSDDFLKIELNAGQLERLHGNNSDDISLETEQQNWNIGQPSNHDESNDIPSGLSERSYQKYNRLLHKLKFGNVIGDEQILAPTEIGDVPTTEKLSDQIQIKSATLTFNQPRPEKIFADEITDVDEDYGVIITMDESQQLQPILAPSGLGFFHGLINFVRWLITSSAVVELQDYEDE